MCAWCRRHTCGRGRGREEVEIEISEMAREAFGDPFIVEWLDETQAANEPRFAALGMVQQRILFIAYAMRGEAIRTISARRALPSERRKYANDNEA